MQLIGLERLQHWHAGSSAWLAIITFSLNLIMVADQVGKAVVGRLTMQLIDLGNCCLGLFFLFNAKQAADKARFFDDNLIGSILGNG